MRSLFLLILSTPLFAADPPKKIEPVIQMTFKVPDCTKGWFGRCDDRDSWEKVWAKYQKPIDKEGTQSLPDLDFKKYMVVAICAEDMAAGIVLLETLEEQDRIVVRYRNGGIQTVIDENQTEEQRKAQKAYMENEYRLRLAFIVYPATSKKVVFEEGSGNLGGPYTWNNKAELPPPK